MNQEAYCEVGALNILEEVLHRITPRNILLVTGKISYTSSGAEAILTKLLQPYQFYRFCEFEQNPRIADVERGLTLFQQQKFDAVIAVGGGSVLDVAKLINIFAAQNASPLDIIKHRENIQHHGVPLIAIPTTAGSGSEATHFAVVYIDKAKYSVAHKNILPDIAIVDPSLTHSMPARVTAVTGMDALSQAIEAFWSVNSTEQSKAYAREAIHLVIDNLENAVHAPSNESRYAMCKASHLAGGAINLSKTTAPHAMSYAMTSYFGVPHGHAVSLTLGEWLVYNSQVSDEDVVDSRGARYVRDAINELNELLGGYNAVALRDKMSNLMQRIGLETSLGELGITSEADYNLIVGSVNLERLANNPRRVTRAFVEELLRRIA